jgi:hypothetical protein
MRRHKQLALWPQALFDATHGKGRAHCSDRRILREMSTIRPMRRCRASDPRRKIIPAFENLFDATIDATLMAPHTSAFEP